MTEEKNPAAVELGRRGGLKDGKAHAAKIAPKRGQRRPAKPSTLGGLGSGENNPRSTLRLRNQAKMRNVFKVAAVVANERNIIQ
jgi:hypothetical protein